MTPESGICPEKSKSMAVIAFLVTNMLTSEYANQFYFNFNFLSMESKGRHVNWAHEIVFSF